ncbi:MAG: MATE family efflux transporter [Eubacterium sp.]
MSKTTDLTTGKISKNLITFALPILISNLFQQFYNLADTAIAGHLLGDGALSAIGASSSINSLVLTFAFGLNGGFGIIISQSFGEKNYEKLRRAFAKMIAFNGAFSVLIAILSLALINPILKALNTPAQDFQSAKSYITILLVCIFATMFYNLEATVLRSLGDSKTPLYFIIFSSLLNIALDCLFMGKLNMGVFGAAAATVIAQCVSAILCAAAIYKNFDILRLKASDFKSDKRLSKSLLCAGMTMALMNSVFSIGSIIMQSSINSLGSTIIAAHLASRKIAEMFMQPLVTIGSSCSTFVSQNYGAGKIKRIKQGMKISSLYSLIWSVLSFFVLFFIGGEIAAAITGTKSLQVIANTTLYLKINAPFYFVLGMLFNLRFSIQSIGARISPIVSSAMELGSKIAAAFLFIPLWGYTGACIAEPISWVLGAVYLTFMFKHTYKKAEKILNRN